MWAIRNKRTKRFVFGTDYRYHPHHQRTSEEKALIFENEIEALYEYRHRGCGKEYEIVPVRIEVLED